MRCGAGTRPPSRNGDARARACAGSWRLSAPGDAILPSLSRIPQGLPPLHHRWFEGTGGRFGCGCSWVAHGAGRDAFGRHDRVLERAAPLALVAGVDARNAGLGAVPAALSRSLDAAVAGRAANREPLLSVASQTPGIRR